jgi:hypothetical protein
MIVKFGEKDYQITPLTILRSRVWREKLLVVFKSTLPGLQETKSGSSLESLKIAAATSPAFKDLPDQITELVFAYAPDLPREEIIENVTESQLMAAFKKIMDEAFPYAPVLYWFAQMAKGIMPPFGPNGLPDFNAPLPNGN